MFNKRKINLNLNLYFLLYLFIATIFNMIKSINNGDFSFQPGVLEAIGNLQVLYTYFFWFLMSLLMTLFRNIIIIIIFVGIKLGIKSAKAAKLSPADFGKYKDYYRNILYEYSPAELSFIDNFQVTEYKDFVAVLLNLKLKKYIDIKDSKIMVLKDNFEKLDENEIYLLNNKDKFNNIKFKEAVIKDALNSGLIKGYIDIKGKIVNKSIFLWIVAILLVILIFSMPNAIFFNSSILNFILFIIYILVLLLAVFYPLFSFVYLFSYKTTNILNPYVRTKKGNEINEKLEGLKNYIKDFSVLDQKNYEDLVMWEEYLIYSVLFNHNKKIVQEFQNTILNSGA
jgi:uncharacterized membrane protein